MFRRRPGKPDAESTSAHSRRALVADTAWNAQDRLRSGAGDALDSAAEGLDRAAFPIEKKVVWPLQDRAHRMGAPARRVSFGLVVLAAAGAGVAGLIWAAPDRPGDSGATTVATVSSKAAPKQAQPQRPSEPTLHGAAPVFKPADSSQPTEVDPAEAIVKSAPADDREELAATETDDSAAATSSAARPGEKNAARGRPAGPEALAVAHDFSDAFVVYETGGLDASVRRAFGATATPELSRALLRRPPRLPANVDVPQAKVLNVVAGPSHEGVYSVSVALLRVGVTSELRLDMEQLKGKEWRVTNVLG